MLSGWFNSSRGRDVRWINLVRSKNDSTGHKTMTLLKRKVTALTADYRSC